MAPHGGSRDHLPEDPESRADRSEDPAHWADLVMFALLAAAVTAGLIWG